MADGTSSHKKKSKGKANRIIETLGYVGSYFSYDGISHESCRTTTHNNKASITNNYNNNSRNSRKDQVQCSLINAFLNRKRLLNTSLTAAEESNDYYHTPPTKTVRLSLSAEQDSHRTVLSGRGESSTSYSMSERIQSYTEHQNTPNKDEQLNEEWERSRVAKRIHDSKSNNGLAAMKNGAHAFLELNSSSDHNARLTMESYREQISELIKRLQRYDLLPMLTRNHGTSRGEC